MCSGRSEKFLCMDSPQITKLANATHYFSIYSHLEIRFEAFVVYFWRKIEFLTAAVFVQFWIAKLLTLKYQFNSRKVKFLTARHTDQR